MTKEIEEIKRKYEQAIEKQEEKMKYDLQQIDKLSVEKKLAHENEKQKVRGTTIPNDFIPFSFSRIAYQ